MLHLWWWETYNLKFSCWLLKEGNYFWEVSPTCEKIPCCGFLTITDAWEAYWVNMYVHKRQLSIFGPFLEVPLMLMLFLQIHLFLPPLPSPAESIQEIFCCYIYIATWRCLELHIFNQLVWWLYFPFSFMLFIWLSGQQGNNCSDFF